MCIKEAYLVLCQIALVRFADDGPLRIETCRNVQCDIIKCTFREKVSAYCWFSVVN